MTRSEAAKICQSIKFMMDIEDYSEEVEEALNMAIAALKQLSLPKIIIGQCEQEPSAQPFTEEQIQTMQELEAAQVEKAYELGKADRPKGHWIEKEVFDNQDSEVIECYQSARCSHCGKYHTTPYMYYFDNYDFCPNCGSYNGGGEE